MNNDVIKLEENKVFIAIVIVLLVLFIIAVFLMCWTPPVCRDSLTHHLAVPKLYLKYKNIIELPDIEFSYYPQLLELLYSIPLYFNNDILPKYVHWFFALLTSYLIFKQLKNKAGLLWSLIGVLFFLSIPVILRLSVTVYVDLGLIFFSYASVYFIVKWIDTEKIKDLIISGIFCGFALSTKYNGLITLFLLMCIIPYYYAKKNGGCLSIQIRALGYSLLFLATSVAIFSPWLIKNYKWTGNPLYPLYQGFFTNSEKQDALKRFYCSNSTKKALPNHFIVRKIIYNENIFEILSMPIRIFFQGKDDDPKYFDGLLNPYLFIFPFALLIHRKKINQDPSTDIMLFFSIFYITIVFLQVDMRSRWVGPSIPCLSYLAILSLRDFSNYIIVKFKNSRLSYYIIASLFAGMFIPNALYCYKKFIEINPIKFISGKLSKDSYIEKYRPEYSVINYANKNLPLNSKILALFLGDRRYYSDIDFVMNESAFECAIQLDSSKESIFFFDSFGISHILLRYDLFNKTYAGGINGNKVKDFFSNETTLLYSKGGYGLYELKKHRAQSHVSE